MGHRPASPRKRMKPTYLRGMGLGLTTGVITTLGITVGLYSGTQSKLAVIGGIIVLALADGLSDAIGMHISEEAGRLSTERQVWEATLFTLLSKIGFTLTFLIPILLLEIYPAIIISVVWGLVLISVFSAYIARDRGERPLKVVSEHVLLTIGVVMASHYIGVFVHNTFGERPAVH